MSDLKNFITAEKLVMKQPVSSVKTPSISTNSVVIIAVLSLITGALIYYVVQKQQERENNRELGK